MSGISVENIKTLRARTGAGMMECKKALLECDGDIEKAIEYLRKKGLAKAAKKSSRETKEGLIGSYVHAGGKIAVLVEVNCETDFVARTEEFQSFVKDIAMHIAASDPKWVKREDVPQEVIQKEKEIILAQIPSDKPEPVREKIAEGKLNKFFQENCLLEQAFVKDPQKTVEDVRVEKVAQLGENVSIRRFVRFVLGEA